ncbi:MAG: aspartate 1-decarboxylase [Candidatus Margulisbacteria bacterium GWF2_35_9]|nr:MAG: aspartate 1-decarboxylase [Candidatus Margulisbacteria bacterium GWF2_35_9]
MLINMCKSKIHRATVTGTHLEYEGSISICKKLLKKADILVYEQVHVVNVNNGQRFATYAIEGETDGEIILNGAAARLAVPGDKVIIIAYGMIDKKEASKFKPNIVLVNELNKIT